jgi:two-component system, OmpR family, sensor histidine kinase KdpD
LWGAEIGSKHPAGFGRHKIFLGYAPGVGKTYQMLEESQRRLARGQDVVVASLENARAETQDLLSEFETIPLKDGAIDTDAIIARKPALVLVDQLQKANPPGHKHQRRWQDVEEILSHGINVLSTVDVMYLESLNDTVADIIGERPKDTVPDRIFHEAEEIELVDLTPRALLNRVERGVVASLPLSERDAQFFRAGNLSALREIAMREAASTVDEDLAEYRKEKRIEKPWATQDRVLICISPTRSSLRLIRRGWRMGQRMRGEVIGVHVEEGTVGDKERKILDSDFALCERLGIKTFTLKGAISETLIRFAKEQNVTAIILGHPERSRVSEIFRPSILSELSRELRTVDIIVVATETPQQAEH